MKLLSYYSTILERNFLHDTYIHKKKKKKKRKEKNRNQKNKKVPTKETSFTIKKVSVEQLISTNKLANKWTS